MQTINAAALTNRDATRYARRVARDLATGEALETSLQTRNVPGQLTQDVLAILDSVAAGWFMIPAGKDLTFSARQFSELRRCAARTPWLLAVRERARAFEQVRSLLQVRVSAFGVTKLPDWGVEAANAPHRLHRLPLEHESGLVTLDLWVQVLQDTHQSAQRLDQEMDCLGPAWMWDPTHPLTVQVRRLQDMGCNYLIKPYVSTTRDRYIDPFEAKLLESVQYHGMEVAHYESTLCAEHARRAQEAQESWLLNFQQIRWLASILDGATSYHQGALTRRLRAESNGAFSIHREGVNGESLTIEIRPQYQIGRGQGLSTVFMLVNYCLALADEIESAEPTIFAYLAACDRALERVQTISGPECGNQARFQRRPPDDFDYSVA